MSLRVAIQLAGYMKVSIPLKEGQVLGAGHPPLHMRSASLRSRVTLSLIRS